MSFPAALAWLRAIPLLGRRLVVTLALASLVASCVSSAPASPTTAPAGSPLVTAAPATPGPAPTPAQTPTPKPTSAPTWQVSEIPPMFSGGHSTSRPVAVAAGATELVAVGGRTFRDGDTPSGGTANAWRSANGLAWEPSTAGPELAVGDVILMSGPEAGFVDVTWGPGGFVAVGYALEPAEVVGGVWQSTDGRDWIRVALPLWAPARPTAVTWNGARYVIVGVVEEEAEPQAAVWLSPDGLSWERAKDVPAFDIGGYIDTGEYRGWGGPTDVTAAEDGELYAIGQTCAGTTSMLDFDPACRPVVWHSPDGATWTRTVPGDAAAMSFMSSLATAAGRVVAVGGSQDGNVDRPAHVLVGSGAGWRLIDLPEMPRLVRIIPWRSGFLAAGIAGGLLTLWTSQGGIEWTQVPSVPHLPHATSLLAVDLASVDARLVVVVSTESTLDGYSGGGFAVTWSP